MDNEVDARTQLETLLRRVSRAQTWQVLGAALDDFRNLLQGDLDLMEICWRIEHESKDFETGVPNQPRPTRPPEKRDRWGLAAFSYLSICHFLDVRLPEITAEAEAERRAASQYRARFDAGIADASARRAAEGPAYDPLEDHAILFADDDESGSHEERESDERHDESQGVQLFATNLFHPLHDFILSELQLSAKARPGSPDTKVVSAAGTEPDDIPTQGDTGSAGPQGPDRAHVGDVQQGRAPARMAGLSSDVGRPAPPVATPPVDSPAAASPGGVPPGAPPQPATPPVSPLTVPEEPPVLDFAPPSAADDGGNFGDTVGVVKQTAAPDVEGPPVSLPTPPIFAVSARGPIQFFGRRLDLGGTPRLFLAYLVQNAGEWVPNTDNSLRAAIFGNAAPGDDYPIRKLVHPTRKAIKKALEDLDDVCRDRLAVAMGSVDGPPVQNSAQKVEFAIIEANDGMVRLSLPRSEVVCPNSSGSVSPLA